MKNTDKNRLYIISVEKAILKSVRFANKNVMSSTISQIETTFV